ncbi:putative transcriptional regulator, TetR [Tsukamurella pulmonis]|uniref:Regulatory protein, tetR family n=1 Tax=Tsukamurella pulmonis TaxID=47312 RepID=A0A1H1GNH2_9ACTN|nr:TetR/AcrR family transcriptional regulator [Tsukamurella pulmonis]KXO88420.1 TetR family transcriptional regulator [Tsukamurella pulmonis]BDD81690.1 putative transcriptional regulator, TetR [Tsukamurella pulmonis]SDR14725.1 regulatory protein, tetR family [Tsukamurella pulmonis]
MARPRVHDPEQLMDAAQKLAAEEGAAVVTVRALSEITGVSNGAIYHSFGSRSGLMAQVWLRAATGFLQQQRHDVDAALHRGGVDSAVEAVVAAADAPAAFLLAAPEAGRFLLSVRRSDLLGSGEIGDDISAALQNLDRQLVELFVDLATALWGRRDRYAVEVVRDCVVELPTALLLRGRRAPTDELRRRLEAAVRGVLTIEPAPAAASSARACSS